MTTWRQKQSAQRAEHRKRSEARVSRPVNNLTEDPLIKTISSKTFSSLKVTGLIGAAIGAHILVILGFFGASAVFGGTRVESPEEKPLEVVIVNVPEPEPIVELEPEPPPPPEPEPEPAPKPKKKPRPRPKRRPPPPDPVDVPPEPPPPQKKKPRRIVGLSLGSTTKGGGGPSFAVGNTRMGQTDTKAKKPEEIKKLTPKAIKNRKATRVPIGLGGNGLSQPKYAGARLEPDYPDIYRAQNLEAKVTIEVTISPKGRVISARIVAGSPHPKFNKNALATARKQKWVPAKNNGTPIKFSITYSYFFTLKD